MNIRYASTLICLLLTIPFCLLTTESALAKKGGKPGGGGSGGNSGPVQYRVMPIPNPFGAELRAGPLDMNDAGQVTGLVKDANDLSYGFLYGDGSTVLLNDLVDLMDPQGREGWHITRGKGINESGQITGHAINNGTFRAFRFDPNATDPFVILPNPAGFEGLETWGWRINNDGDIAIEVTGGPEGRASFINSGLDGAYTHVFDGGYPTGINDRAEDCSLQMAVSTGFRMTIDASGEVAAEYLEGLGPFRMNNAGTIVGSIEGRNTSVAAVYTNQVEVLKNGRKDIAGLGVDINSSEDVGIRWSVGIYTDRDGLLSVEKLIHPDDIARYNQNSNSHDLRRIGERDSTGFFLMLVGGQKESFVLVPEATAN